MKRTIWEVCMVPTNNEAGINAATNEGFEPFAVAQEMILAKPAGLELTPPKPQIFTIMYFKRPKEIEVPADTGVSL